MSELIAVKNNDGSWSFQNVRLGSGTFRNFRGEESTYNQPGQRNFCIFFEDADDVAHALEEDLGSYGDSWPIKWTKPNKDGKRVAYLKCHIRFGEYNPPVICLMPSNDLNNQTFVTNENLAILDTFDWMDILDNRIDVSIRPYDWMMPNGRHGRKAMVTELYVVNKRSALAEKYARPNSQSVPF